MRLFRYFAIFVIAVLAATSNFARAQGPIHPIRVGNWIGGSYTDDRSGAFSHCAVSAGYQSGISLSVSVTSSYQWMLAFSNPAWNMTIGQQIPIDLTFDGRGPVRVYANPIQPQFAIVPMPSTGPLIKAFRQASIMTAFANNQVFQFALSSTGKMLPALVQCVRNGGVTQTASAPTVAPPTHRHREARASSEPQVPENAEASAARKKLLSDAANEYGACIQAQMRDIVPFSNEDARTLSQVVITKCADAEEKFITMGMAVTNSPRADIQKVIDGSLEQQRANIVAQIVTFRADTAKAAAAAAANQRAPAKVQAVGPGI